MTFNYVFSLLSVLYYITGVYETTVRMFGFKTDLYLYLSFGYVGFTVILFFNFLYSLYKEDLEKEKEH